MRGAPDAAWGPAGRMNRCRAAATLLLLLGAGVAGCGRGPAPPLTTEALRNASYHAGYVEQGRVTLRDGRYESDGETPIRITLLDPLAFGDLDGDGAADAAALLAFETGGSGVFVQLAPVLNRGGRPLNPDTTFLGDRVKIERLRIEAGQIVVDLVTQGPGDPMCCPTRREARSFRLRGRALEPTGVVSPPPPAR